MERGDRNKECDYVKLKNPTVLIQKITSLLAEPITKYDIERQGRYIDRLIDISKTGFCMSDLHDLMLLVETLVNRIEEMEEYSCFLNKILQICIIPPIMTLSSDILTYSRSFQEFFTMLGYTLTFLKNEDLQVLTTDVLITLLTKNKKEIRHYVSLESRLNCALNSQLLEILSQLLHLANEKIYPNVLIIVKILVKATDEACKTFIQQDAINYLMMRLEPTWKKRFPDKRPPDIPVENVLHFEKVEIILLILLKYMTNHFENMKDVKNIEIFSLWNLQYAFRLFARTNQTSNRNNVLVILLKIIFLFPDLNFVTSGLANDLIITGLNFGNVKTWAKHVKLSADDEDRTYLELLISALPLYMNFFGGIRVLEEQRIVYQLLTIARNRSSIKWNPHQVCVLSHLALDTLMKIVPSMEEEFIENSGATIFLDIIRMYKTNNIDILILRKCLEALLYILKNTIMVIDSILFNNGISLILGLCDDIVNNLFEDNFGTKCLTILCFILDILYRHSVQISKKKIIKITITYMKKIVSSNQELSVRDTREIVGVMNLIWEHIVKDEAAAKEFVKRDGAFLMLDMVQKFPFVVQIVTLGALVDLCQFEYCIPYLITWKRNGEKILPMLMKLFRKENKKLKVKTGSYGQISDTRYPLMGKDQWFLTFCTCKPMTPGNACISDLFVSCRPKIYAILQMLHMRHAEAVEIANEHYKSYNEELQPQDQVTRLIAENFLALKLGEAWTELKEEFDRLSIVLTSNDHKFLSALTERANKLTQYLHNVQNEIIQNTKEKELFNEYKLYKHLAHGKLTDALEALRELKAIARSSEHMFRISEKYKQNKQIDDAVKSHNIEVHATYFDTIRVTPVFNQNVNLTKMIDTEETDLVPVSPIESKTKCDIDIPEDLLQSP